MYKVAKVISVLLAVSLLLAVSGVLFAQTLDVTLDRDFISNAAPGFTTTTVTITDTDRNITSGPNNDGIATTSIQVLNVQTGDTIDIAATESTVEEGVFTATFTVNSITSTVLTEIMAADGQQLRVNYTTGGGSKISARTPTSLPFVNEVLVDGTGPVITNTSPAHNTDSRFATQTFKADITDAAAGLGADDAAVRPRITFEVQKESLPLTLAPNADATVWTAQVQTTFLTAAEKNWQITARDALGNVTVTDSETADETDGDQLFIVRIDITAAGLAGATNVVGGAQSKTGAAADTSVDPVVNDETAANRKSIRVGFNEPLDGTSINADGSDFLVLDGENQLAISSADWHSDLNDSVYLTLVNDLDPDSTPVIRVVREIDDVAGNPTVAGEVTALDGLPPAVTVSLLVGRAESSLTNDTLTIRVVADESSVDPAEAFDLAGVDGLLVAKHDAGAVFVTSTAKAGTLTTLSAGTQWEWEFTFDAFKTADDEGVYNVYAAISDSEGNMGVAGLRLGGDDDDAVVEFQVDRGIPFDAARDIAYSDDDPNTFINIDFGGEGRTVDEYVGDSHDTVSAVTATIDGVSVEVSTIDNITFTIPPQALSVTDHLLEVEATDEAGNTVFFDDLEIKIVERADFSIPLRPGLNIVSLPGGPSSAAINDVIPATHPINQVFTYDPTKAGGWLVAERGDDGLFAGTLTSINDRLAYFVRTTSFEPVAVFIPRLSATERVLPPAIALKKGWNLVPVADTSGDMDPGDTVSAEDYLAAIDEARVYRLDTFGRLVPVNMNKWDTTTPDTAAERAAKSLIVGQGYWVYANEDGVIIP